MKFFRSFASRYIRFFLLGLAAFVVLESAGLLWLDKVYLRSDSHISVSTLDSSAFARKKGQKVDMPAGATDIRYSYDGGYVSYMQGDRLTVVDMSDGTQNVVPDVTGEKMKIVRYVWVSGRNRIILAERNAGSTSKDYIRFYYYLPSDTSEVQEVGDVTNNQRISIDLGRIKNLNSASATVDDIDFSTANNMIYVKIRDKNERGAIYSLDADNNLDRMDTSADFIGQVLAYQQNSGMLYEDSKNGYVYSCLLTKKGSTSKLISAGGTKKLRLLGVDEEDNIYLAPTAGDTTSTILKGTVSSGWQTISLGRETSLRRITVTHAGQIYVDDSSDETLRNVTDATQTAYAGTLVGLYNGGFLTQSDSGAPVSSGRGGSSSASVPAGRIVVATNDFSSASSSKK